jgi:hypothetical protein
MRHASRKFSATQAEIDAAHRSFDFLIPFQHKQLLSTEEVARCLGREVDFVRQLVELGKLEAFQDSAFGTRLSNRITRRSVVVHLARTAQSPVDDFAEALIEAAASFSHAIRTRIINALQALNNNRS